MWLRVKAHWSLTAGRKYDGIRIATSESIGGISANTRLNKSKSRKSVLEYIKDGWLDEIKIKFHE